MFVNVVELVFPDAHHQCNASDFVASFHGADPVNRVLADHMNLIVNIFIKLIEFSRQIYFSYGVKIKREMQQRVVPDAMCEDVNSHVVDFEIGDADNLIIIGDVWNVLGNDGGFGKGATEGDIFLR